MAAILLRSEISDAKAGVKEEVGRDGPHARLRVATHGGRGGVKDWSVITMCIATRRPGDTGDRSGRFG